MSDSNSTDREPDVYELLRRFHEADDELKEIVRQLVNGLTYHGDATTALCERWRGGEINRDELLRGLLEINRTPPQSTTH